jgi:hypothetical protein
VALGSQCGAYQQALVWPWCGLGVALVWPWGGSVLRSLCLVYAYNMALGWLWVALRGLPLLFLLSTFYFLLLPECGFGWLCRAFLHFAFPSSVAVSRRVDCLLPFPKRAAGTTNDPKCPKSRTCCIIEAPAGPGSSVPRVSRSLFVCFGYFVVWPAAPAFSGSPCWGSAPASMAGSVITQFTT